MTLLDEPPVVTEPPAARPAAAPGQPAAWRFATRLARRETRRRPGRTVLVALLIAAPVLVMTLGSVLVRTDTDDWATQFQRDYRNADVVVNPASIGFSTDEAIGAPPARLPDGTVVDDHVWIGTMVTPADPVVPGTHPWVVFTDIAVSGRGEEQSIEVVDGRAATPGEMMLDADTARELGVEIGDTVVFERPSISAPLVGIGQVRARHWERLVVVPGFDRSRIAPDSLQLTITYDLPAGTTDSEIRQFAQSVGGLTALDDPFFSDSPVPATIAWGWVGSVLAFVAVGIIIAAAFATSARRQLVTIGQLTANGASATVVRRTLALQGTWTGAIGAVVGIGVGLVALPFVRPLAERVIQRDLPGYVIGWIDLVVILLTATVAATIAAAVPARSASRIPVMAALAGRRPLGKLPAWLVPTGLALAASGLGLMTLSTLAARNSTSVDIFALLTVIGVIGVVFGMCCATPIVVEQIGRLGRRASLSWRLALRSLARARTRSAAVVAAIAVAVGGSVASAALVETTMAEDRANWLPIVPADTVVLQRWSHDVPADYQDGDLLDPAEPDAVAIPDDLRGQVVAVGDVADVASFRVATFDPAPFDPRRVDPYWRSGRGPLIADTALVRAMGIHPDDVATLERVGSLRPRAEGSQVFYTNEFGVGVMPLDEDAGVPPVVYETESGDVVVSAPVAEHRLAYENWQYGTVIITEEAALDLGFGIADAGGLVRFAEPLTPVQRAELSAVNTGLNSFGFDPFVEPGDPPRGVEVGPSSEWNVQFDDPTWRDQRADDVWIARAIVIGAAVLLSLLVVSIGLSLAAAEGRDERNTLAVVGATPRSMRRQAAARAAVLAGSGIALGIPTGFVPTWVLYRIANDGDVWGNTLGFPWLVVGTLIIGVPLLVAIVAGVASGVGQRLRPATPTRRD